MGGGGGGGCGLDKDWTRTRVWTNRLVGVWISWWISWWIVDFLVVELGDLDLDFAKPPEVKAQELVETGQTGPINQPNTTTITTILYGCDYG